MIFAGLLRHGRLPGFSGVAVLEAAPAAALFSAVRLRRSDPAALLMGALLPAVLVFAGCGPAGGGKAAAGGPFFLVPAAVETDPVPHGGDAADDVAVWVDPKDPSQSLVVGTDKKGGLALYDLSGRQVQYLAGGRPNNVDLRSGFMLEGKPVALAAASDREANAIALYVIDPGRRRIEKAPGPAIPVGLGKIYGLCMYHSPKSGSFYVFADSPSGEVEQYELREVAGGGIGASRVRSFTVGSKTEGCAADDDKALFYIAEERAALWRYGAEPDSGAERLLVDRAGSGGHLVADIEGVALFRAPGGKGFLIASSQGDSRFALYDRGEGNRYMGSFRIADNGEAGVDGVSHTDGIEAVSVPLGPRFPGGLFVAQDDDNASPGANQDFKLVSWDAIARGLGRGRGPGDEERGVPPAPAAGEGRKD